MGNGLWRNEKKGKGGIRVSSEKVKGMARGERTGGEMRRGRGKKMSSEEVRGMARGEWTDGEERTEGKKGRQEKSRRTIRGE